MREERRVPRRFKTVALGRRIGAKIEQAIWEENVEAIRRRREFEEALRNVVAKLGREGNDRIDRSHVEEIGQRYDLDPDEARKLFVKSRGEIWQGELIESEEEPGWEAATLRNVPSTGISPDDSSV